VKTLCKEDSWTQNDNQQYQKKLKDESFVIYHKSTSDKDALAMMCERDEEPPPIANLKIAMACAHYMTMDTCCWY